MVKRSPGADASWDVLTPPRYPPTNAVVTYSMDSSPALWV